MILGPNDPRAIRLINNARLLKPRGKTLKKQVEDIADRILADMSQEAWDKLEKSLDGKKA